MIELIMLSAVSLAAGWALGTWTSGRKQAAADRQLERLLYQRLASYRVDYARLPLHHTQKAA